jgi:hypothetical protein
MSTLQKIEAVALRLPKKDRLHLADKILGSQPDPKILSAAYNQTTTKPPSPSGMHDACSRSRFQSREGRLINGLEATRQL